MRGCLCDAVVLSVLACKCANVCSCERLVAVRRISEEAPVDACVAGTALVLRMENMR